MCNCWRAAAAAAAAAAVQSTRNKDPELPMHVRPPAVGVPGDHAAVPVYLHLPNGLRPNLVSAGRTAGQHSLLSLPAVIYTLGPLFSCCLKPGVCMGASFFQQQQQQDALCREGTVPPGATQI